MGPRTLRDVILIPFEMAIREGGARSVMNSYSEIDGLPVAADPGLLTGVLRGEWGFDGDRRLRLLRSIVFVQSMHRVAATAGEAAALSLEAGIDVELPHVGCYAEPLAARCATGTVDEALVDRAVRRVLRQKGELGLLDADWSAESPACSMEAFDIDPPEGRALAREIAEASVVLLANDGALPLAGGRVGRRSSARAPTTRSPSSGCYSFPNHGVPAMPTSAWAIEVPTLLEALRGELRVWRTPPAAGSRMPTARASRRRWRRPRAPTCAWRSSATGRACSAAARRARAATPRTSRCRACRATWSTRCWTPARPSCSSWCPGGRTRSGARGRPAAHRAGVLPGRGGRPGAGAGADRAVVPTGRLPVQVPRSAGAQPGTYLHPVLGGNSGEVSNIDPTPAFPFGHGLPTRPSSTSDFAVGAEEIAVDGEVTVSCVVRNVGERAGAEVVQLYLSDPVAQVTRPVIELVGYARVPLEAGASARVTFSLHADRTSFTGRDLRRIVEPGDVELMIGASAADIRGRATVRLVGEERVVGYDRVMTTPVRIET